MSNLFRRWLQAQSEDKNAPRGGGVVIGDDLADQQKVEELLRDLSVKNYDEHMFNAFLSYRLLSKGKLKQFSEQEWRHEVLPCIREARRKEVLVFLGIHSDCSSDHSSNSNNSSSQSSVAVDMRVEDLMDAYEETLNYLSLKVVPFLQKQPQQAQAQQDVTKQKEEDAETNTKRKKSKNRFQIFPNPSVKRRGLFSQYQAVKLQEDDDGDYDSDW